MNTVAVRFPHCTEVETRILQLRAQGKNYRDISTEVHLAPRKVSDLYFGAMKKVIRYLETSMFLEGGT